MVELIDVTPGSWAVDLTTFVAALGAVTYLFRLVFRLVVGVEALNKLLAGDVLERLDEGSAEFKRLGKALEAHGDALEDHEGRLNVLEQKSDGRGQ